MPQTKKKHKLPVADLPPPRVIFGCSVEPMENRGGSIEFRVTYLKTGEARIIRSPLRLQDPLGDYLLIKTVAEALNISTPDDH